ncbi:hypothetical protein BD309DRAFT_974274 [Dichomitus squalens]|uniref:F-box domain-containing protein n=1 Tax=Dichomitus squalens TaxID=114155 RepID=A0A4Q9M7X3_9APHY|nr:hypothetical protein BD311DRAFT_770275 [Dichomitus squalens]TBU37346.1 hypothetical protein BD309DRAFT_974274 [Dichomitus squalens]TBU52249.1 hypothetical protein BD310DRAFT_940597 [Dichomitus squalens]
MDPSPVSSKSAIDGDRAHPDHNASRLPIEVCENIIDMLDSLFFVDRVANTRALHRCALVCRAWRVRSQRNLFYSVVLHDLPALQKFSAVLDNTPHLCEYVYGLTLTGHTLHTTASPLSLLPIALLIKLTKLQDVTINRLCENKVLYPRTWYPYGPVLQSAKFLQYLPLHPRFALFFSAFTAISRLYIFNLTFGHFKDLARMINCLPALRTLDCEGVRCMALGPLPFNMKPRANGSHAPARPFAPNLQVLCLLNVDIHCVQRLVFACGPRLRQLMVTMPFVYDIEMVLLGDPTTEHTVGVDLSLCSTLERLDIGLDPEVVTDGQSFDKLKAMLHSWDSKVSIQNVHLRAWYEDDFTRKGFADLLGTAGRVLEDLFHESSAPPSADGEFGEQGRRWRIWVELYDWEVWRDWWSTHVQKCFPTLAKSDGLGMNFLPPSYNLRKWKDSDALPPMPTTTT